MPEEFIYDQNEIQKQKKKKIIFFSVPVLLIVLVVIFYKFLNFGTLVIVGDAPFEVILFEQGSISCNEIPCEKKLKPGETFISYFKMGHTAKSDIVDVPLWRSIEITPTFTREPFLQEVTEIPQNRPVIEKVEYEIKYDKYSKKHKLIAVGKIPELPIAYFPNKLKSPKIIGTQDSVIIIEQASTKSGTSDIYYIDIKANKQINLGTTDYEILAVKPSPNGRAYLLKTRKNSKEQGLYLANQYSISKIYTAAKFEEAIWTYSNKIIFVEQAETDYDFKLFDPETNTNESIYSVKTLTNPPSKITVDNTNEHIYFKSGPTLYLITY